jgi:hypothetical protein
MTNYYHDSPVFPMENAVGVVRQKLLAKNKFTIKTNLVTSTEFCQAIFDERDIREGWDGGGDHRAMIPSPYKNLSGFSLELLI